MADLKWGLTDEGVQSFGDDPESVEEWLSFTRGNLAQGTVNGVPLADVLNMAAISCDSMVAWSGVSDDVVTHEQVEWEERAAALRALAEMGESE